MDKSSPDEAELELWSLLVEKYEDEHFPIPAWHAEALDEAQAAHQANPDAGSAWPEVKARCSRKT